MGLPIRVYVSHINYELLDVQRKSKKREGRFSFPNGESVTEMMNWEMLGIHVTSNAYI